MESCEVKVTKKRKEKKEVSNKKQKKESTITQIQIQYASEASFNPDPRPEGLFQQTR